MNAQHLVKHLNEIYNGEPWFGESLLTKLNSLTPEKAYQQPNNKNHSIAQILSHMEFWRKSLVEQLSGKNTTTFTAADNDNWPPTAQLQKLGWQNQLNSFEKTHQALIHQLMEKDKSIPADVLANLAGMIDHDIYHLGQIGYVKSLLTN